MARLLRWDAGGRNPSSWLRRVTQVSPLRFLRRRHHSEMTTGMPASSTNLFVCRWEGRGGLLRGKAVQYHGVTRMCYAQVGRGGQVGRRCAVLQAERRVCLICFGFLFFRCSDFCFFWMIQHLDIIGIGFDVMMPLLI